MDKKQKMSAIQKAAVLLISLGPDTASKIYKQLTEKEVEKLTMEISSLRNVTAEKKDKVVGEFHQIALAQKYITQGGLDYAKVVLEKAFGYEEATKMLKRLNASLQVRPFDFAKRADAGQILHFIQNEHPQTIALVLSYLDPEKAGQILSELPTDTQADIARRIAVMDGTSPDVIREVEEILKRKLSATVTDDYSQSGGIESIVQVLQGVDRATEKTILDTLGIQDPGLAEDIRERMFVFEDIVILDNLSIQRVIRECDSDDLMLALRVASDEVKETIFKNMSTRMAVTLQEEIELMGPVRLREIEEAQSNIVAIIRRLEDAGEIILARGGDEIIV
ncbi:flagellar motor switch protein FliG [Siminovitchia acidinfaciens]|uniref:Flagellar motor switch protein FliG n=1 Tax=Siminovitchia acidinfaciens TaxID=2321395 RepID=A0A429Y2K1_9BACI|nr:flagellar motor switch protein FliG [Siminovitchia acidinfaciens]RST75483.1 flagellar motor switch protein FliG [Siminovitchia acidinfaciens]VEF48405.1 flagellar motor switch protein FliG [Bacillus freudenreichii]